VLVSGRRSKRVAGVDLQKHPLSEVSGKSDDGMATGPSCGRTCRVVEGDAAEGGLLTVRRQN
jgi:hypothetical protein